jgi:hypothetical protein
VLVKSGRNNSSCLTWEYHHSLLTEPHTPRHDGNSEKILSYYSKRVKNVQSTNIYRQTIEMGIENRLLRRIFGPKRDEVTGGWRKLHNEELHNLYFSPSIIRIIKSRRMAWAWHVARIGEKRNAYRILVEKPEGKRPLGRQRRRWVRNIKMDLR